MELSFEVVQSDTVDDEIVIVGEVESVSNLEAGIVEYDVPPDVSSTNFKTAPPPFS